MCCHAPTLEFRRWTVDWHMVWCLPARCPSEGRLERDAPVGVLVDRNGGCRKILPEAGCFDGGFCEAL